jgi:hypothetical protein
LASSVLIFQSDSLWSFEPVYHVLKSVSSAHLYVQFVILSMVK